jgi:hypothetical protein
MTSSNLPRKRGLSSLGRAPLAGRCVTGVTLGLPNLHIFLNIGNWVRKNQPPFLIKLAPSKPENGARTPFMTVK